MKPSSTWDIADQLVVSGVVFCLVVWAALSLGVVGWTVKRILSHHFGGAS